MGSAEAIFFLRLWTAAHKGERLVAQELEVAGIQGRQLAMLLLVGELGPASTTVLATELGVPFMTASDALQRLVEDGVVAQAPNPADRRSYLYELTEAGRARVARVEEPLRRAAAAIEGALADTAALDAALTRALE
jgi:MarR family transcriptional regulator, lower aerobic nicotinate degradation pathway regulator